MICADALEGPAVTIGWWSDWGEKLRRLEPYQSLKYPQEAKSHYKGGAERFSETSEVILRFKSAKVNWRNDHRENLQFIIVVCDTRKLLNVPRLRTVGSNGLITDWEWCRRNRSWPNFRYDLGICVEKPSTTTKTSSPESGPCVGIWTQDHSNMQQCYPFGREDEAVQVTPFVSVCSGGEDGRSCEALLHADWWRSVRLLNLCTRCQWVVSFTRWLLCKGEGFWTGGRPHVTNTTVVMYIFDNTQFVSFRVHNIFASLINSSINLLAMNSEFNTTLLSIVSFLGVGGRSQGR
jgi:hypothetical protein